MRLRLRKLFEKRIERSNFLKWGGGNREKGKSRRGRIWKNFVDLKIEEAIQAEGNEEEENFVEGFECLIVKQRFWLLTILSCKRNFSTPRFNLEESIYLNSVISKVLMGKLWIKLDDRSIGISNRIFIDDTPKWYVKLAALNNIKSMLYWVHTLRDTQNLFILINFV